MSQQEADLADAYAPERLAEASVWMTRLKGDDRDQALEDGLRKWLQASPQNGRAFELATELWDDTYNLRRILPIGQPSTDLWHRFRLPALSLAAAATLALVAFGLFLYSRHGAVTTAVGEQRLVTLDDGSRVFLNTSTRIRVNYDRSKRAIELEGGEALFDVAREMERPFIVHAGDRSIVALGTSFVVRYDQNTTAVTLVEGKVSVRKGGDSNITAPTLSVPEFAAQQPTTARVASHEAPENPITLTPGERLQVSSGTEPEIDRPSLLAATAWRRGQVILNETPLSQAVKEMNRYSNIKLSVSDSKAGEIRISGLFQAGDSVHFANAMAKTHDLHIVRRANGIDLASRSPDRTKKKF